MRPCLPVLVALTLAHPARAADDYQPGPDSLPRAGVPRGTITKHTFTSQIFPGTVRDYWTYVPAQYDPRRPTCLMVFQDGESAAKVDQGWRAPVVLDNLI